MLCAAALMCHAPIVIPTIAGSRGGACEATTRAMGEAARHLQAAAPARVVVISPHAPRGEERATLHRSDRAEGHFGRFGREDVSLSLPGDPDIHSALLAALPLVPVPAIGLDHGALVPLWFLREAGLRVPVTVLGLSWSPTQKRNHAFGRRLREVMDDLGAPWALIASGDMSHALQPGAPGGFHPQAHRFDAAVVASLQAGRLQDVSQIEPSLRMLAREDVVDSLEVATGALPEGRPEVISYEAPFGVGYLEARLA